MVTTRRAPLPAQEQPTLGGGEPQTDSKAEEVKAEEARGGQQKRPEKVEVEEEPGSPSKKRPADQRSGEERAEKRRQLTPAGEGNNANPGYAEVKQEEGQRRQQQQEESKTIPTTHSHEVKDVGQQAQQHDRLNVPQASSSARADILDTARQILKLYAHTKRFEYLSAILSRANSRKGRQYKELYEKFQRQRRPFHTKDNFIPPASLDDTKDGGASVENQRFARCINFVTFASSMLGSRDASFAQLNDHFFEVFIDRTGGRTGHLLKLQGEILLGLKTQAYVSRAVDTGGVQEQTLNELFPSDMSSKLQALQPDPSNARLVSSEQTFVRQITMRKRHLRNKDTPQLLSALKEEYKWNDVLKAMLEFLRQHFEEIAQKPSEEIYSMNDAGEESEDIKNEEPVKKEALQQQPPSQASASARSTPAQGTTPLPQQQQRPIPTPVSANAITSPSSLQGQSSATRPMPVPQNPYNTAAAPATAMSSSHSAPSQASLQTAPVTLAGPGLDSSDDILMKAVQAANQAMDMSSLPYSNTNMNGNTQYGSQGQTQTPHQYSNSFNPSSQTPNSHANSFTASSKPPQHTFQPSHLQSGSDQSQNAVGLAPNGQSQPTHQLYEMAREATTGRPQQQQHQQQHQQPQQQHQPQQQSQQQQQQQPQRRSGSQSQRRPWTQEEEKALLDGLDAVKGPHWSMILQLYGPGGKVSEVLKDRNQVQLKDKARNLKLWFLKSGGEVPVNLRAVTGELKTRAPAAMRNAAAAAAQGQPNGGGGGAVASGSQQQQALPPGQAAQHPSAHTTSSSQTSGLASLQQQQTQHQHQQQQHAWDPNDGSYAPASTPYTAAAAAMSVSTASSINPQMPTAGPRDGSDPSHGAQGSMVDQGIGFDAWGNDAADAAAAQVIRDLTGGLDFDMLGADIANAFKADEGAADAGVHDALAAVGSSGADVTAEDTQAKEAHVAAGGDGVAKAGKASMADGARGGDGTGTSDAAGAIDNTEAAAEAAANAAIEGMAKDADPSAGTVADAAQLSLNASEPSNGLTAGNAATEQTATISKQPVTTETAPNAAGGADAAKAAGSSKSATDTAIATESDSTQANPTQADPTTSDAAAAEATGPLPTATDTDMSLATADFPGTSGAADEPAPSSIANGPVDNVVGMDVNAASTGMGIGMGMGIDGPGLDGELDVDDFGAAAAAAAAEAAAAAFKPEDLAAV